MTDQTSPGAGRATDMYAEYGPNPVHATEHGLDPGQVESEFRLWREEYLDRWQAGEQVPEPPYADVLDNYADSA
jgi:hypothetical protein